MTAPERIWVGDERPVGGTIHVWNELAENARRYATEYTRADLVPDPAGLVRAALEAAADACRNAGTISVMTRCGDMYASDGYSSVDQEVEGLDRLCDAILCLAADPAAVAEIAAKAKGAGE
jgi:ABC-type sugar transport system substrate-binding protein